MQPYSKVPPEDVEMSSLSSDDATLCGDLPVHETKQPGPPRRPRKRSSFAAMIVVVFTVFFLITVFPKPEDCADGNCNPAAHANSSLASLSLQELYAGKYRPQFQHVAWLPDGTDGEYLESNSKGFVLAKWPARNPQHIVNASFVDDDGTNHFVESVVLSKDRKLAVLATDSTKHWRHSFYALYWLLDVSSGSIKPLSSNKLSLAKISPTGETVAYVYENNIYLYTLSSGDAKQITFDGGKNVFNGIPDWVYEEEVFAGPQALWWSEDGSHLAYLHTNETEVPVYPVPYFFPSGYEATPYPDLVEIKYPKPGFPNPEVDVFVYSLDDSSSKRAALDGIDDKLVTEVLWLGSAELLVKVTNRESDVFQLAIVDPKTAAAKVVRESKLADGQGWFEVTHNTVYVPADPSLDRPRSGYLDTVIEDGYTHLAYFTPADAPRPHKILTAGRWEVCDTPSGLRLQDNEVYFTSTHRGATERHLYRVSLLGSMVELLTPNEPSVFETQFSGDASYALVTYRGPGIPYQKILNLGDKQEFKDAPKTSQNDALAHVVSERKLGDVIFKTADCGNGVRVNVREIRPFNFSESKKYPVLFFNYGGPGSQQVLQQFGIDFQRVFAETHDAIVVTVDPRGTGFKGTEFRAAVRDHLGDLESHDVIAVAKQYARQSYVNKDTLAIWGWSYGGYLTLKTLEQDAGETFRFGVAVAPVTDWRLYDSIYTERYMHTPEQNPEGYAKSAISDVKALNGTNRFLVMHGTGDDNVHFQNTLALLDKLDLAKVENYDVHVFPDSDHSISFHNANPIVFDKIDSWLRRQQDSVV